MATDQIIVWEPASRKTPSQEGVASPVLLLAAEYDPPPCPLVLRLSEATSIPTPWNAGML